MSYIILYIVLLGNAKSYTTIKSLMWFSYTLLILYFSPILTEDIFSIADTERFSFYSLNEIHPLLSVIVPLLFHFGITFLAYIVFFDVKLENKLINSNFKDINAFPMYYLIESGALTIISGYTLLVTIFSFLVSFFPSNSESHSFLIGVSGILTLFVVLTLLVPVKGTFPVVMKHGGQEAVDYLKEKFPLLRFDYKWNNNKLHPVLIPVLIISFGLIWLLTYGILYLAIVGI